MRFEKLFRRKLFVSRVLLVFDDGLFALLGRAPIRESLGGSIVQPRGRCGPVSASPSHPTAVVPPEQRGSAKPVRHPTVALSEQLIQGDTLALRGLVQGAAEPTQFCTQAALVCVACGLRLSGCCDRAC